MTLKQVALGLDLGNGWPKIVLDNKASKIPNWSVSNEPKGQLNAKTMIAAKPMAFSLEIDGNVRWFGQDTLSLPGYQEIDSDKLKPEYIRMMFKATLYRWLSQHKIAPEWLADKRLNVVCGMPPELYQDRLDRNKAEKVYRYVFDEKRPQYIKLPNKPAIAYFTAFGSGKQAGLRPETLVWRAVHKQQPGFTLLVDLGYGTSDLCLLHKDKELPIKTVSLNNGLLHSHNEINPINPWISELGTMRGDRPTHYANVTKSKIRQVARQINLAQLVIFGGGVHLLDAETLRDLKGYADVASLGRGYDEFSNARWFEALAKRGIEK